MKKRPKADKSGLEGFDKETGLPEPETALKAVADATGRPIRNAPTGRAFTAADLKAKGKRAGPETAAGRVKFTTMLHPDLREMLEALANARGITKADALEIILTEYRDGLKA